VCRKTWELNYPMKLFVGLGNPGEKYAHHRHNVGFMAVERIAAAHGFSPWRRRFQGETAEGTIDGERVLLLKPLTYMNESGRAVGEAARFLKLDEADVIVFHDELDLLPGKLKVKVGGGNAGHNGLRSVSAHLGNEFVRVRIGIGHPGSKDAVIHYVLRDFAKSDADWLDPLLDVIAAAAAHLARGDHARFQSEVARSLQPRERPLAPVPPESGRERKSAGSPHPAGERDAKRRSALAENLRRWLAARAKP
jgi:PTH1 family peptidyl-tRNA hydrolase